MILCDIGNSTLDWYINGIRSKQRIMDFNPSEHTEQIYYISVNSKLSSVLKAYDNWCDIANLVDWNKYYPTMGIDRVMVCEAISEGVIVDAGSAITVDVMHDGHYKGGFIALGLKSAQEAYAKLSPALSESFNFEVDLTIMAKNTPDAITVGFLAPLIDKINSLGKPVYVTGGDSVVLSQLLCDAIVDDLLVFKGMIKLIEKGQLC
ncbi:MAG TPA: type III pantothenate kinase [Sulfuricurvum sp.]|nr:MAG: pantothenate kinase [Campylobacterales bacterium 16-40-21]OZA03663.1 MAG: pantothenate kinase [Sulfuricurvum sp. 17-40-25]HQS65821.1 type III pantothenate kinase [Sulfuricurvum sp.]HQT37010.1 type III pantothenate kinase [Sulfuricurvum sp.]